jgi:ABC-type transport system substrate-binding protein
VISEPPRRPRSSRRGVLASQGLTAIGVPDARQLLVSLPSATTFVLSAHASRTYVSGQVVAGMATETDPDEPAGGLGPDFLDSVQIVQKNWKAVGIEVDLKLKETGAFLASALYGRFDKLMMMIRGSVVYPDSYLVPSPLASSTPITLTRP